jgi:hypothetical protein
VIPQGLVEALERQGAEVERTWSEAERTYVVAGRLFARASRDPADVAVLAHEAQVREVVGQEGPLRAPRVLERGPGWLLEQAVEAEPLEGETAVAIAAAAADRIPELKLPMAPRSSAQSLSSSIRRGWRILRSPIPRGDVLRARRILREAGPTATSHGDFHPKNILLADGAAWVVDWELSGTRPRGYDLMYLAATLEENDRAHLWQLVSRGPDTERLLRLRYAVTVSVLTGKLAAAQEFDRDPSAAESLLRELPRLRAEAGFS